MISARFSSLLLCLAGVAVAVPVAAQTPGQPPPPPPGFEPQGPTAAQPPPPPPTMPPPGYYPPPPGYPPPGYGPPPGYMGGPEMLGPKTMDYEEGDAVPPGYHVDTRIRKGLLIGGAVTFGSLYLLTAATAAALDEASDDFTPLYVPAVGPFITIGTANAEGAGTFILIVDGVAQSGGLLMAVLGLTLQQTLLVRNDVGAAPRPEKPRVSVTPMMVGKRTMGVGLVGSM